VTAGQTASTSSPIASVQPYADKCHEYDFLAGFLDRNIYNDGTPFLLTETERCVLYIALTAIGRGKSMVIHDPFPSSSIPLALCGTHTYSQRPSLRPTGDTTRPMLAFPSSGYTTNFWKFHWRRCLNPPTQKTDNLYPVETVNALSEMNDEWGLSYVPTTLGGNNPNTPEFNFDFDAEYPAPSAVFVDLQRPEWAERRFGFIEELREEHPGVPFVFYTGEMDTAAQRITRKLGVTPLRVTNGLLATATPSETVQEGESELAIQERIIRTGTNFDIRAVHDDRLSSRLGDIYEMKDMLRDRRCAYPLVSAAYNSLTKFPVQPSYWTRTVATNPLPTFSSTPDIIEKLRQSATDRSTADGDLLRQYADAINDVQGLLNERHPLQTAVLGRIHDVARGGENTRFVVSNTPQKKALQLALDEEGYAGGADDDALIIEKSAVRRSVETRYVYLYPPYRTDTIFEFPPSTNVEFITFSVWKNVLADSIAGATRDISARTTTTNQNGDDGEDDFVLDLDALDDDISEYLDKNGLSERRAGGDTTTSSSASGDGERIQLTLAESGETVEYAPSTYVPLYDPKTTTVVRKRAESVSKGESILLIPSVSDDLYEALIDDAHERESVRQSEERVEDWRAMLVEGMDKEGLSYEATQKLFAKKGSGIESDQTIKFWASGHTIGPQDPYDVRRAIELFRPGLTPEFVERRWNTVWSSIKHIRFTHHEMGRNVKRYIEAEMSDASDVSLKGVEDEEMLRTITRDVDIDTIAEINRTN
jgi:hypothetical protein